MTGGRAWPAFGSAAVTWLALAGLLALCLLLAACGERARSDADPPPGPITGPAGPVTYVATVVATYPHDATAFTQGLVFHDGRLYESTGIEGQSTLREVDLATGAVRRRVSLPATDFGEGIALLGGRIYQLTWQSRRGYVYDAATFAARGTFTYDGEGWGLTTDGQSLILSDGTSRLRFLDPTTFAVRRTVDVTFDGAPVTRLNELEWVRGEIYANIWFADQIARIDPATGRVVGWIDLAGLLPAEDRTPATDVLNGIAYDAAGDRLFVTGKRWPKLFQITLRPRG